ncbi:hypothetical protein DL96DRAFT_1591274 [Flagelloscypha sp. PMI_526]|nr:hypothetical protein DL96DRAFT_1591274 [Flagelloscypha sp. PMI_526]
MRPTPSLSGASRRPLLPKRGNKDYYKGTGQAILPGRGRTGAPGRHHKGGGGYTLVDTQVRVFVAPPIDVLNNTPLRAYVHTSVNLTNKIRKQPFPGPGALTAENLIERSLKWQKIREAERIKAQEVLQEEQVSQEWGEEFVPTKEELEALEKDSQEKSEDLNLASTKSSSKREGAEEKKKAGLSNLVTRFWGSRDKS